MIPESSTSVGTALTEEGFEIVEGNYMADPSYKVSIR